MGVPNWETIKMLTSNGQSPHAAANIAANCGLSPAEVSGMIGKGRKWLEAEAARLKAAPPSLRRDCVLAAARGAWLVAGEGT